MSVIGSNSDVKLGDVAKDAITGFQGVVIGIASWLNQCDQVCVKAQSLSEGKPLDAQWFDITNIEIVEGGKFAYLGQAAVKVGTKTGGPSPAPMPVR